MTTMLPRRGRLAQLAPGPPTRLPRRPAVNSMRGYGIKYDSSKESCALIVSWICQPEAPATAAAAANPTPAVTVGTDAVSEWQDSANKTSYVS